jgi:hypothetical protein
MMTFESMTNEDLRWFIMRAKQNVKTNPGNGWEGRLRELRSEAKRRKT